MCKQCDDIRNAPKLRRWDVYLKRYSSDASNDIRGIHLGAVNAVTIHEASDKAIVEFGYQAHQMRIVYRT